MANGLYKSYKDQLWDGAFDLLATALDVSLIDAGTVDPDVQTHDFYDDLVTAEVATFADLAGKAIVDTTNIIAFDATDVTFTSVTGATVEDFSIFEDDATDATSSLLVNFDTATGLPLTPNGADVTLQFDSGSNRIMAFPAS